MPPKSREQADEAGPFKANRFYRYSDLEGPALLSAGIRSLPGSKNLISPLASWSATRASGQATS